MIIIPSIDLQEGQCVRLKQGQFDQVAKFNVSPLERASQFKEMGTKRMHVVDLDGAKSGQMQQLNLICAMHRLGIEIQVGGGIRTIEQAKACIDAGIDAIVLGSIAINDQNVAEQIIREIGPEKVIIAADIRMINNDPMVLSHGWQNTSSSSLWEIVSYYQRLGITTVLCTDIAKDGMMDGPNFSLYQEAVMRFPTISWQASGGIRGNSDIEELARLGVTASIMGLALYQQPQQVFNPSHT